MLHFNQRLRQCLWVVVCLLPSVFALFATPALGQQLYNPVADPAAVVQSGQARFTVLTPKLIRLEWAADGQFEDRPSFVVLNRRLPVPAFTQAIDGDSLVIHTDALELRYKKDSGKFTAENLTIRFTLNGTQHIWSPASVSTGNLMGTTRTLDGVKGDGTSLEPGLLSRDGWSVIDDSKTALFDSSDFRWAQGESSPWPWVVERTPVDRQDLYFLGYGHAYREAMHDYTQIAGKIPLPPRFAFGAWWSRYWDYSATELQSLVAQFHEHDVPLDVLVIDMGWHLSPAEIPHKSDIDASGHSLAWTGYTWNPKYFPDPNGFLNWVHSQGLKATLNLHPASGVQPWEKAYPEMAKAMGIDPATQQYVPFDITSKKFATNYLNILHHPLENQGIDFWWLDWQQEMTTKLATVNPTWWLNYVHFTDQEREGKRPLIFHRWGGLGNHRYQIGFSGDTVSVWESLAFQPYFTATAANVAYAYWSHDIGGHMPGAVAPELYTRWIQFGIFSPILRTHTTKNPEAERRIWAYPDPYASAMKAAFQLRYAMQPYLYTEARRTWETGVAFLHPLYYDSPEADQAYARRDEYKFGDNMVVAPIVTPADPQTKVSEKSVWLPEGDWVEWMTGERLKGPGVFDRKFQINQIPVYVRAGSIVPEQPEMRYTGEKPIDPLIFEVLPFADAQKESEYSVYEDSDIAERYQQGEFARTPIRISRTSATEYLAQIGGAEGTYQGMPKSRAYELHFDGVIQPTQVTVDGHKLKPWKLVAQNAGWRFDKEKKQLTIRIDAAPVQQGRAVKVVFGK